MTIFWGVLSLGCAGGAAWFGRWAWMNDGWRDLVGWPAAVLLGLVALIAAIGVFTASSRTSCPSCGATIHDIDGTRTDGQVVMCEGCHAHARIVAGHVEALPPDYVHPSPVFTARLGDPVTWCGCVGCGGISTRELSHELKEGQLGKNLAASAAGVALFAVAGAGFVQTGGGKVWRVAVPYCDGCSDGVALDTDLGRPVVRFRSHAVARAFCQANGLTPMAPPS